MYRLSSVESSGIRRLRRGPAPSASSKAWRPCAQMASGRKTNWSNSSRCCPTSPTLRPEGT